jgi:hypothetical protein
MATVIYDPNGNAYLVSLDISGHFVATPVVIPPPPVVGPSGTQGWSVTQIVTQVMGRTENRASGKKNFDPRMEFFLGLDEFVSEKHFWWRRKSFSLSTIVGELKYDLSSNGTGQANAGDCVEIEEMFVINSSPQYWPWGVPPHFDARDQVAALYGNANIAGTVPQSGYFMALSGFQQLVFMNPPTQVNTVAATYYAVPMVTDTTVDVIPLVPPNLHWGLLYMFERRIYEYLFGMNDPRFAVSNKRYQDFLLSAAKNKQFSQQQAIHSSMMQRSITATGGRGRAYGNERSPYTW